MIHIVAGAAVWELFWWARRRRVRSEMYEAAAARAAELGRPLIVVGAPDGGMTSGYGCGDATVDLAGSSCPNSYAANICTGLPFDDDSAVIYVSCVLEYVDDYDAAMQELYRVSGGQLFLVRVEPWTATAFLYPGAKRRLRSNLSPQ